MSLDSIQNVSIAIIKRYLDGQSVALHPYQESNSTWTGLSIIPSGKKTTAFIITKGCPEETETSSTGFAKTQQGIKMEPLTTKAACIVKQRSIQYSKYSMLYQKFGHLFQID